MNRIYNFNAGPAALPEDVLRRAQSEMLDWRGTGMSVMEMSHRSKAFREIAEGAEADLRSLLGMPDDHAVLFLQGGATSQFAVVPLNLTGQEARADYVVTGSWSKKALGEAGHYLHAHVAATGEASGFTAVPPRDEWNVSADARYLHYTPNETIGGVEFHEVPDVQGTPLVADMSSTILSRPLDVSRFGVIYAGAQKNIGPAGLTLVLVRRDLLGHARSTTPMALDYTLQAKAGSMLNTPPCFAWYVCGLVFRHLLEHGGLEAMGRINERKARKLYDYVDASALYGNPIEPAARSWMNVPFLLAEDRLDETFLAEAEAVGLHGLKGHRSVGGMRASLYNAVTEEAVDVLLEFMQDFETRHG